MTSAAHTEPSPFGVGALRLSQDRTTTPDFSPYPEAVTAHCPYLGPSIRYGLTHWTTYDIVPGSGLFEIEAGVFTAAVNCAEQVRVLSKGQRGNLVCENIVVRGASRRHLNWPHWALKNLYSPVGLMFGKFWEGEEDTSRAGLELPVPPVTFISVRPAVRLRDPNFLNNTPALADMIREAEDDGRDVLDGLARDWQTVRSWAAALPMPQKETGP